MVLPAFAVILPFPRRPLVGSDSLTGLWSSDKFAICLLALGSNALNEVVAAEGLVERIGGEVGRVHL